MSTSTVLTYGLGNYSTANLLVTLGFLSGGTPPVLKKAVGSGAYYIPPYKAPRFGVTGKGKLVVSGFSVSACGRMVEREAPLVAHVLKKEDPFLEYLKRVDELLLTHGFENIALVERLAQRVA
jgi:hypothetical protein